MKVDGKFSSQQLLAFTEEQVWTLAPGLYEVDFPDGKAYLTQAQIQYSSNYWPIMHQFNIPLRKRYMCIGYLSTRTHKEISEAIFQDVIVEPFKAGKLDDEQTIWQLAKAMFETASRIFNSRLKKLSAWNTSACAIDFMEVIRHPDVVKAKEVFNEELIEAGYRPKAYEKSAAKLHSVLHDLLFVDKQQLMDNGLKKMCIAQTLSENSLMQILGSRGFPADINGKPFPYPIEGGYWEGLKNIYDMSTESRSATISLLSNTKQLKDSEYHNRQMQLLCMVVRSIKGEDCGEYVTVKWLVKEGQEKLLRGSFYMDENNQRQLIWGNIDHLVGKVIELRNITGCGNHDTQSVCKTCMGFTHLLIPRDEYGKQANVGWCVVSEPQEKKTQGMLSTKHYMTSAISMHMNMNRLLSEYFRLGKNDRSEVYLNPKLKKNLKVRLEIESVANLNHILSVSIQELSPSAVTRFKHIYFVDEETGDIETLDVTVADAPSFLSEDALIYLKEHGWKNEVRHIEFSLEKWDIDKPLIMTPKKGDSMYLFHKNMRGFIVPKTEYAENDKEEKSSISSYRTRGAALADFVDILQSRLSINIVQASIYIRACMAVDPDNGDYRLPHPSQEWSFANASSCLFHRNLSVAMAYEQQEKNLTNPHWFTLENACTHPLDDILRDDRPKV